MSMKQRIESMFGSWTRFLIRFRFPVLLLMMILTVLLGGQARHLTIDTSNEGLLQPDDPILTTYNNFRDQFGRDDLLVMAIKSDNVFTLDYLSKLKELHEQLESELPHVNDVTSMVNARETRGQGDTLLVDDLLLHFPENDQDLADLKKRVLANPVYVNQLVSTDGNFSTILIESDTYSSAGIKSGDDILSGFEDELEFDSSDTTDDEDRVKPVYLTDQENAALVAKAEAIAAQFNGPDFEISMAGSPAVIHTVKQLMLKDMKKFLRLAVLTIGICLFIMFRRISGVIYPLLVVALTLITTLGLMATLGVQFKVPTIILPSFLLAVGVGASVHVLSLTYQRLRVGDDKYDALTYAMGHSGLAIVMTSFTTAAGLASFATAEVAPIADLGLFSSIGVIISLLYTLILLPTLLAIFPLKQKKNQQKETNQHSSDTRFDRFIDWAARITTSYPKRIVFVSALVVLIFAAGIPKLHFSHNQLSWLPEHLPVRVATEVIDNNMRGSVTLEIVLDTGSENGLYDRDVLQALDTLATSLESFEQGSIFVGKVISVTTILKEIHKALHENRPEMYTIPDNGALIPQEFLLFENSGSDDLQDFVDSRFSKARVTIKVPWRDALTYVPFIANIEDLFGSAFQNIKVDGTPVTLSTTGIMSLFARILNATMRSAAQSYGMAIVVITLMMILLIGNLRMGLIAMIPNISPILITMGIMGWFSIPLDMFTMLVASIAIGLAVDDTIHFVYNFKKYYEETGDVHLAVGHTLHTAGRAMLTTSIVLSIGFFLFMLASMNNVFYFGMLIGLAIIIALLADFILAPALMALALPNITRKNVQTPSV